jgi:hypothetical protein
LNFFDTIILGPHKAELEKNIQLLKPQFQIEEDGDLCDYLGVKLQEGQMVSL